jgi:predicted small lipoprotein YifL
MNKTGRTALFICFALLSAACGRKGALIYPDMLVPAPPAAVSGRQSGSVVKLQFVLPDKDMSGRPVKGVAGAKISRMASEAGQKDLCRSCLADYLLLQTLNLDHLPTDTERFGNRLILLDGDVKAGNSYSYRIVPFTVDGIEGVPAAISDVRIIPPISGPDLKIESLPTEIRLQFAVQSPLYGRLLGYNLYRSPVAGARSFQPLNSLPLTANEFVDIGVERGVKYRYAARMLVELPTGIILESLESAEVVGILKDDE